MKKIIVMMIVAFCIGSVSAQTLQVNDKVYKKGDTIKANAEMNELVGKWTGGNADTTFIVVLKMAKSDMVDKGNIWFESLIGGFSYSIKGKEKFNSLGQIDINNNSLSATDIDGVIKLTTYDPINKKYAEGTLKLIGNNKMVWHIGKEIRKRGKENTPGFAIPVHLILEKRI